jgi:hypothetical protein
MALEVKWTSLKICATLRLVLRKTLVETAPQHRRTFPQAIKLILHQLRWRAKLWLKPHMLWTMSADQSAQIMPEYNI